MYLGRLGLKPNPQKPFPRRFFFGLGVLTLLAVLLGGLWYLANLPYLRVDNIEISGIRLLSASEIEAAARENTSGVLWHVFPRGNFFFVSSRGMADNLVQKFPQVSEISVDKKFPNKLMVTVRERTLWGVYCQRPVLHEPDRRCAYIDQRGTAYEDLASFEGWLLPLINGPQPIVLGQVLVAPDTLQFFAGAKSVLRIINGELLSLTLSSSTPEDGQLELAEGWQILVTMARPAEEWSGLLQTILDKDIGPRRNELEYIDLRFGNKVFYKYR